MHRSRSQKVWSLYRDRSSSVNMCTWQSIRKARRRDWPCDCIPNERACRSHRWTEQTYPWPSLWAHVPSLPTDPMARDFCLAARTLRALYCTAGYPPQPIVQFPQVNSARLAKPAPRRESQATLPFENRIVNNSILTNEFQNLIAEREIPKWSFKGLFLQR